MTDSAVHPSILAGYQVLVHGPSAGHSGNQNLHLIDDIQFPYIMAHHKLIHLAIQVLSADIVINALMSSFEH